MNRYVYFYILSCYLDTLKGVEYPNSGNPQIWHKLSSKDRAIFWRDNGVSCFNNEATFWNKVRKGIDNLCGLKNE